MTVTVTQLKAKLSEYVKLVEVKKEEIEITKNGKIVGVISPQKSKQPENFKISRKRLEELKRIPSPLSKYKGILDTSLTADQLIEEAKNDMLLKYLNLK